MAGAVLFGAPPAHAELAKVRGLQIQWPGPLRPDTRDEALAQGARQAVAAAWQAHHPGRRAPALYERLVDKAIRHIDILEETVSPDLYTLTLDVAVAMDVLRVAAGLPAESASVVAGAEADMAEDDGKALPTVRVLMPTRQREQTAGIRPRWIHVGADGNGSLRPVPQPVPFRVGTLAGSGRIHPGFHCLSVKSCTPE